MAESQMIITLEKMECSSESKIRQVLERINGILKVTVSLESKKISIEYDDEKLDEQFIKETIEDEGFKVK